jgi:hypothetical protein
VEEQLQLEAYLERDSNPLAGGRDVYLEGVEAAREAVFEDFVPQAPAAQRSGHDLVVRGWDPGQAYAKVFTKKTTTKIKEGGSVRLATRSNTAKSYFDLLARLKEKVGVISPAELFSIQSTLYTPSIPPEFAEGFAIERPFQKNTERMLTANHLVGELLENTSREQLEALVFDPDVAKSIKGLDVPEGRDAEFARLWHEAREAWHAEVKAQALERTPAAGILTRTFFEPMSSRLGEYLKWAKASVGRGFAIFEPIGRDNTRSPRETYIDAIFNDVYRPKPSRDRGEMAETQRVLKDVLGEVHDVDSDPLVKLTDIFTREGFHKVARAYEVLNGIGTEAHIKSRMELQAHLQAKKESLAELELLAKQRMSKEQAKRIVDAVEAMDHRALTKEGVEMTVIPRTEAVGATPRPMPEAVRAASVDMPTDFTFDPRGEFADQLRRVEARQPTALEMLEGFGGPLFDKGYLEAETPTGKQYFKKTALASSANPVDAFESAQDLRRVPKELINAGELITLAQGHAEAGDTVSAQKAFNDASLSMASAIEKVIFDGKPEVSVLEHLTTQDISTVVRPLQTAASHLIRTFGKEIHSRAKSHGWFEESGGTIRMTEKMARLVGRVAMARGRHGETRFERGNPVKGEGADPRDWICGSDCAGQANIVKKHGEELIAKLEKEGKPTKGLRAYVSNLYKLWFTSKPTIYAAALTMGRQIANPAVTEFRDSLPAKLLAGDRNRFGDLIPTVLHKRTREAVDILTRLKGQRDRLLEKAGFTKLNPLLHERPSYEAMSAEEKREVNELGDLLDVVEGRAAESVLSERAKRALPGVQELFHAAKTLLSKHIFREVFRAAEDALKEGRQLPPSFLRPWRRIVGETNDPQQVLDILNAVTNLKAGETATIHGRAVRGWGLKQYYPHVWAPSENSGSGLFHLADPGAKSDADVIDPVNWVDGGTEARWIKSYTEDHARKHGFMGRTKQMNNLRARLKDKDGYIRDFHWVTDSYFGRMVEKITHERMGDDLVPLTLGDWKPLDVSSAGAIEGMLQKVPGENKNGRHALLGGVDHHFGLKLRGNLRRASYETLSFGQWEKQPWKVFGKEQRSRMEPSWRADLWRVRDRDFTGPEEWEKGPDGKRIPGWKLSISNSRETLVFYGKKAIEAAGIHLRDGGILNYTSGKQWEAVKDLVRRATGYDPESEQYLGDGPEPRLVGYLRKISDVTQEFFNQSMLGGIVNAKAFFVQTMEGMIQNASGIGLPGLTKAAEAMKDGFMGFQTYVLAAADPAKAYFEAKEKFKNTRYVREVLPVLERGHFSASAFLSAEAGQGVLGSKAGWERARRISYGSFRLGDLLAKELAYYGSMKGMDDVKQYQDPETGQLLDIVDDYIPLGDMFTRSQRKVSKHDIAMKTVQQLHFQVPKWSQPGLTRIPGWTLFGHLGTVAANVSAEFWYSMGALAKYAKTGDDLYAWQARKGGQYIAALAGAMLVMKFLGRDIGSYVGPHISDVGFGEMTLGNWFPALRYLNHNVRVLGFQFPKEKSLPVKALLSGDPREGIPAAAGDAMRRWLSGEQTITESIGSVAKNWLARNNRNMILGPFTRSGIPLIHALTAERSDLDPDRPWMVRDPWYFGPDQKTRFRNSFDLYFGDLVLPGYSYRDAAEMHRSKWAKEMASVRGEVGRDLRKQLRSYDPETSRAAYRELLRRGYKIQDYQTRKAQLMDRMPSYVRSAFAGRHGSMDTASKLRLFSDSAASWEPAFRQLALRWILPEKKSFDPSGLPEGLWSEVQEALNAPWER